MNIEPMTTAEWRLLISEHTHKKYQRKKNCWFIMSILFKINGKLLPQKYTSIENVLNVQFLIFIQLFYAGGLCSFNITKKKTINKKKLPRKSSYNNYRKKIYLTTICVYIMMFAVGFFFNTVYRNQSRENFVFTIINWRLFKIGLATVWFNVTLLMVSLFFHLSCIFRFGLFLL